MADNYCTDCKSCTETVFDHSAGDTICSECGLVLESRSVDETSEWRCFADDTSDNDPNRVGSPVNPFLSGGLATVISKSTVGSCRNLLVNSRILAGYGADPDRSAVLGFKSIATMADRLSLVATIKDCANEMYKKLDDQKCTKGRNMDAISAACIYIACRMEGKARTLKEICSVANGASKKDIGRALTLIDKQLKDDMSNEAIDMGTINAGEYLRRFCSNLGMSNNEIKAVQETLQRLQEFDIRRNPSTVVAAIIFLILQLSDKKITLQDISRSCTVAEGTIRNAYKDIYPHSSRIVPQWYATETDLKRLYAVRN